MLTLVLNGTTNGISLNMVIERICFVDIGGPLLSTILLHVNTFFVFVSCKRKLEKKNIPKSSLVKSLIG